MWLVSALALILLGLLVLLSWCHPPRNFAPGLPVVPIWVPFLPLIRSRLGLPLLGQDEVYARYIAPKMAQHGAVVIYFGSRWNILVGCPQAFRRLFLDEKNVFRKSGNHIKLPNAVISQLTGGNIISETGEKWKRYASIIRPALKDKIDRAASLTAVDRLMVLIATSAQQVVSMVPLVQRFAMENLCLAVFDKDLEFLHDPPPTIHTIHAVVKRHIFHPLFLSFPFLDSWTRLFPSRVVAREMIAALEVELLKRLGFHSVLDGGDKGAKEAVSSPDVITSSTGRETVLDCLRDKLEEGFLTQREFIDNLKILFIAGHENIQQALVSTLWQLSIRQVCGSSQVGMARALAEQQERQDALRLSLSDSPAGARSPQVHAFLYEVLRLYPPIPQLFNRCVAEPAALVLPSLGVPLRPGTYVGWTAFGLHRGPHASLWQPDPAAFRPERWGDSVLDIDRLARKANSEGQFATFHGGARACPGQSFALDTLHSVIAALLSRYRLHLAPGHEVVLSPGGLLSPRDLRLRFEELAKEDTEKNAV